jgi:hypothetical protein
MINHAHSSKFSLGGSVACFLEQVEVDVPEKRPAFVKVERTFIVAG